MTEYTVHIFEFERLVYRYNDTRTMVTRLSNRTIAGILDYLPAQWINQCALIDHQWFQVSRRYRNLCISSMRHICHILDSVDGPDGTVSGHNIYDIYVDLVKKLMRAGCDINQLIWVPHRWFRDGERWMAFVSGCRCHNRITARGLDAAHGEPICALLKNGALVGPTLCGLAAAGSNRLPSLNKKLKRAYGAMIVKYAIRCGHSRLAVRCCHGLCTCYNDTWTIKMINVVLKEAVSMDDRYVAGQFIQIAHALDVVGENYDTDFDDGRTYASFVNIVYRHVNAAARLGNFGFVKTCFDSFNGRLINAEGIAETVEIIFAVVVEAANSPSCTDRPKLRRFAEQMHHEFGTPAEIPDRGLMRIDPMPDDRRPLVRDM